MRQDGQLVGVVKVTGDRCCYRGSDDRLIIDYHVTMIGYGKNEFHIPTSLIEISEGKSSESVQCAMLKVCDVCADMGQL